MAHTVLLIVEENEADRMALAHHLHHSANLVYTAANPTEAMAVAGSVIHISAMVGTIPEINGSSLFDFRDYAYQALGAFPSAFCSKTDMSAYYSRVIAGDKLFYKPVEIETLKQWLVSVIGLPAPVEQDPVPVPFAAPSRAAATPMAGMVAPAQPPVDGIEAFDEDLPIGTQIGDYRLDRIIQRDRDFALYEAEQTSINRKVAIKTLYRKHRRDPVWVQAFVNEASARARVNHPNVSLVYECIQEQGVNFYTLELVDSPSLADLAAQRTNLSDDALWHVMEACCSALEYFRANQMQHRIITPQTILVHHGDQVRIANPVKSIGGMISPDEEKQQLQILGTALKPFIRKGSTESSLYSLIDRLGQERIDGIRSIDGLRRGLNADTMAKTSGLSRGRVKEITAQETNKNAIVMGSMIGLAVVVIGGFAASYFLKKAPEIREFKTFSKIPEGPFPFQNGPMIEVPEFWMSQQEVTIAQYAEFLADIASKPTSLTSWQHPDQPADKTSHVPERWNEMYQAALKGKKFLDSPIDPNCPVSGVDWWDAYTYARWKNARLPTEKEWEKAARSRKGSIYPWGNEIDHTKFNSGIDQKDSGDKTAGSVDGFVAWAPVDALSSTDISSYGVNGMAGNVSEWTATWDAHPDNPDKLVPIKRGASFRTIEGFESTSRRAAEMAEERNYFTGFRIVSDINPGSDPNYTPPPPERIAAASLTGGGAKGKGKGKADAPAGKGVAPTPAPPAPTDWNPADGVDPFTTIFASPVGG